MSLWFHGTDKDHADVILEKGFKSGTFFGKHMEEAYWYGGPYIFVIFFDKNPTDYWEYVSSEIISASNIFMLYHMEGTKLYHSKEVEKRNRYQFHKEVNPGKKICAKCEGKGELGDHDVFDIKIRGFDRKIDVCPDCNGHGVENYWGDE